MYVWAAGYVCTGVAWFSVCVGLTGRSNRSKRVAFGVLKVFVVVLVF